MTRPTISMDDLTSRPRPKGDARIAYGPDPLQHVDLWLPAGPGPHPIVLMIHGGCWQTSIAGADIMDWAAADLRDRGIAVWNIEYRGVDRPGGGHPGTFHDVAVAADALRGTDKRHALRLDRIVAVGHSAGGHLALWLAARAGLPPSSPLRTADPLPLHAAISLGGLPDLRSASLPPYDAACGAAPIARLVGRPSATRPDVYADTSPAELPPPAIPILLVSGGGDTIAPPAIAEAYAARVGGGTRLQSIVVPGDGHFDLIAPGSASWAQAVTQIEAALR